MRKPMAGHIYVLEVSDGLIKVGLAGFPAGRLKKHGRDLRRDGREILRHWVSPQHLEAGVNEETLITSCERLGGAHHGLAREWFSGIQFDDVVASAGHLPFTPRSGDRPVRADEVRHRWRDLLDAAEHGEHITILRYDRPVAVLVPVEWHREKLAGEDRDDHH